VADERILRCAFGFSKGEAALKLRVPLYGCPDASKMWLSTITYYLAEVGLTATVLSPCVFPIWNEPGGRSGKVLAEDSIYLRVRDTEVEAAA
jgi:hypothetical protein